MRAQAVAVPRPSYLLSLRDLAAVASLTLLIAIAAQVRLYLAGNPVPVTLQTLAVVLCGLWARPAIGTSACVLYVALGAVGAPVFADFNGGLHVVIGPTAGYLLGFLAAPALVAVLSRKPDGRRRSWPALCLIGLAAHAVVLAQGVVWLKFITGQDWTWAVSNGLVAFLPGTILKSVIAAGFATR